MVKDYVMCVAHTMNNDYIKCHFERRKCGEINNEWKL